MKYCPFNTKKLKYRFENNLIDSKIDSYKIHFWQNLMENVACVSQKYFPFVMTMV